MRWIIIKKKSLKAPIEEASESALLFFFPDIYIYIFFFFDKWNIWFLRVFFSKLRFAFVRFDAKERSKCLPGMLVYLNLDNCALEIGVEMDIKPERDLLYFGGGFQRGLGEIFWCVAQPMGRCMGTDAAHAALSRVLNVGSAPLVFPSHVFL